MQFEVRHFIPGRVRLRVPLLIDGGKVIEMVKFALETQPGVLAVRINPACGAVVIEFDRNKPEVWVELREKIAMLSPDMLPLLQRLYADRDHAPRAKTAPGTEVIQTLSGKFPLGGPTASLALSFFVSPYCLRRKCHSDLPFTILRQNVHATQKGSLSRSEHYC